MAGVRVHAPWPDYAGSPIHAGDTLRHPTGETGTVVFLSGETDPGDQWRVDYGPGSGGLSRLCLQIGSKGQAVVVAASTGTRPAEQHVPAAHAHRRVSAAGRQAGAVMARLADAEIATLMREGEQDERCQSCAFRAGTVPNGCAQTQLDVQKAVTEDVPFLCHCHRDRHGRANRICYGWFAVRRIVDRFERATGRTLPPCDYDFSPPDAVAP
jgi:hypothetical protein